MLYDILPPIILFASFGGIIAVVSRVMLRVRKQEISQQIQNEVASQESVAEDRIFKKAGIGKVSLVKNRLLLVPQTIKTSIAQTKTVLHERMEARKERKARQEELRAQQEEQEAIAEEEAPQPEVESDSEMKVKMPTQSWRDRLAAAKEKVVDSLPKRKEIPEEPASVTTTVPLQQEEQEAEAAPVEEEKPLMARRPVRLRRVENKAKKEEGETDPEFSSEEVQKTVAKTLEDRKPTPEKEQSRLIQKLLRKSEDKRTPIEVATLALEGKEYGRAEDVLVSYIMKHTRDAKAYMLLGQAAVGKESWDEAVEIFQQVMKIDENQKGAYAALGCAAMNAGKVTLALQSLQRAHDEDPTNIEVLERLLTIARRMDNKVLQRSVTEELAALQPQPAEEKRVKVTS